MPIFLLVAGLVCLGASLFFLIRELRRLEKNHKEQTLDKKTLRLFLIVAIGLVASGCLIQASINTFTKWQLSKIEAFGSIAFAGLFNAAFATLWSAFYLHYYKPDMEASIKKKITITMFASIPVSVIAFLLFTCAVGNHLSYPLVSGIAFKNWKIVWMTAATSGSSYNFKIAFYGVFIIFGALVTYWISDHRVYKRYHKHGLLEGTLFVGLLCGIIGARVWYVVGNWNGDPAYIASGGTRGVCFAKEVANGNWGALFAIWNGGLTILGGAIGGIIGGVLWTVFRRKYLDIRWVMDMVIPGILIAQAIGRFGNFFNCEVYGYEINQSALSWLPNWISNQMHYGEGGVAAAMGKAYIPLFLIEATLNVIGYFVIAWGIPAVWKKEKGRADLSLTGFYLLWYGVTRIIMEPFRDPNFNMGQGGSWSIWNALVWIIMGVVVIVGGQILDYCLKKKAAKKALEAPKEEESK